MYYLFDILGCRLNYSETATIAGSLVARGHSVVEDLPIVDIQRISKKSFTLPQKSTFSKRQGTRAAHLENIVDSQELQKKCSKVRILSQQKREKFYQGQVGKIKQVLLESQKEHSWFGYTENYVRVKIQAPKLKKNSIQRVKIQSACHLLAEAQLV